MVEDYEFEMHDLRQEILKKVAEKCRNDDLLSAKFEISSMILQDPNVDDRTKVKKHFRTSFDNAKSLVEDDNKEIRIEEVVGVSDYEFDENEIKPDEIEGDIESFIISIDNSGFEKDKSVYPVYSHETGYRVCSCPSQKFSLVCKHTLARVMERNWPERL